MKVWRDSSPKKSPDIDTTDMSTDYVGDDDEKMKIVFYERSWIKSVTTYLAIALSGGLLGLVFFWRPHWMQYCTHRRCSAVNASRVVLTDKYDQIFNEKVIVRNDENEKYVIHKSNGDFVNTDGIRYFDNKKIRYLWDKQSNKFERLHGLDHNMQCSAFLEQTGLKDEEQTTRTQLYGQNRIEIKVQSYFDILYKETLSPFYIFQIFAIILWSLEEYYYYAAFILFMSIVSIISSSVQLRRNQSQLRATVSGEDVVEVWKGGDLYVKQSTARLVPGDVIVLPEQCHMYCDAVLVAGNVVVDESLLTGESVPVIKSSVAFSHSQFSARHHFKHIIFSGTKVIQTRYYGNEKVKAVVMRTAFQTVKGELVRSILFPKPIDFKFNRHVRQFIGIMVCIAFSGFVYTMVIKLMRGDNLGSIFIKLLDLITIVVPPELPAALTIASVFVDKRLRSNQIYCLSPRSINMAGCIDSVCFDKTGTLTEDELHLAEVLPNNLKSVHFSDPITSAEKLELSPLLVCLASCHSLTILDNEVIGDPLDIKMFEATKWVLEEPEVSDAQKYDLLAPTVVKPSYVKNETDRPQVAILRQFPFSSNLSRMSVITRLLGDNHFELYVKGAPEVIAKLCDSNTVPKDFDSRLLRYTQKSYRVLAIAFRPLDHKLNYTRVQRAQREELEKDLIFLGLVVMKNNLKDKTVETIDDLHSANIRTLMCTGDNLMTAVSVAQECHLVEQNESIILVESPVNSDGKPELIAKYFEKNDSISIDLSDKLKSESRVMVEKRSHLAMEGQTFVTIKDHFPELVPKMVICGTVFARMSPENKQQLIESLQQYGYIISMTGDGANDVGALKASNCGISLADTEASVAAPFTSKTPNISCVTTLLREGRASLVSVFGVIKYMACYNVASFIAVLILYSFKSNLTDIENLYQDLCVISVFVFLFGRTEPYHKLSPIAPPTSLISVTQLMSIVLHTLVILGFQMMAIGLVWHQSWYREHEAEDELDYQSHDNYAVFTVQVFQYICMAIVFSKGTPYRKPFYTNVLFAMAGCVTTLLTLYIVIAPDKPMAWVAKLFELETNGFTFSFRGVLVAVAALNFVVALVLEDIIIGRLVAKKIGLNKEKKYEKIAKECHDSDWFEIKNHVIRDQLR